MIRKLALSLLLLMSISEIWADNTPTGASSPSTPAAASSSATVTISPSSAQLNLAKSFFDQADFAHLDQVENNQQKLVIGGNS